MALSQPSTSIIQLPPGLTDEVIYVSQERIQTLLKGITSIRDRAIFTLGYWRGLRASEVGKLQYGHWMPASGQLWVIRAKGSVSGVYTLSPEEKRTLLAWLKIRGVDPGPMFPSRKQRPISRQMLDKLMKHYGTRASWPEDRCMFKVLRHSIATHLLERGVDIYQVKDWLGHKTVRSTEVYAKITNKQRREAEEKMYREVVPAADDHDHVSVDWGADTRRSR